MSNKELPKLPVFKERRMTGIDPATGNTVSYNINESFAGILRLSPNNSFITNESTNLETGEEPELSFSTFEDTTDEILGEQFLKVSTSDGVPLDFRVSKIVKNDAGEIIEGGIEYNNLYILGAAKTDEMEVHIKDDNTFKINNALMPQTLFVSDKELPNGPSLNTSINSKNIKEAYILINNSKDDTPNFEYINAFELITKFIGDALVKISSLPTGSIHWIPLTIQQYKALLDKEENSHNGNNINADPIIRDFLLCDGSKYKTADFPELAKILKGEQIVRWKVSGEYMEKVEETDSFDVNSKTFRVPDLRTMFIQYIIPEIDMIATKDKDSNNFSNRVGSYESDSFKNEDILYDLNKDKHYHYIVLDNPVKERNNTKTYSGNSFTYNKSVENVKDSDSLLRYTVDDNGKLLGGAPLAKYGSMRVNDGHAGAGYNGKCTRECTPFNRNYSNIPSYILRSQYGS